MIKEKIVKFFPFWIHVVALVLLLIAEDWTVAWFCFAASYYAFHAVKCWEYEKDYTK